MLIQENARHKSGTDLNNTQLNYDYKGFIVVADGIVPMALPSPGVQT